MKSNKETPIPISSASMCPPIADRALAADAEGCTNRITILDPRAAANTASARESTTSRIASMARVARKA